MIIKMIQCNRFLTPPYLFPKYPFNLIWAYYSDTHEWQKDHILDSSSYQLKSMFYGTECSQGNDWKGTVPWEGHLISFSGEFFLYEWVEFLNSG